MRRLWRGCTNNPAYQRKQSSFQLQTWLLCVYEHNSSHKVVHSTRSQFHPSSNRNHCKMTKAVSLQGIDSFSYDVWLILNAFLSFCNGTRAETLSGQVRKERGEHDSSYKQNIGSCRPHTWNRMRGLCECEGWKVKEIYCLPTFHN